MIGRAIARAAEKDDRNERERVTAGYDDSRERLYADPEAATEHEAELAEREVASLADRWVSIGDDW